MSRYLGDQDRTAVFEAAVHWRDSALRGGGSVFSEERIWTADALESLDRFFVQRPDEGDGRYFEKLQQQLAPSGPTAQKLAAEMIWLMYLCPSSLTANHKRQTVMSTWSWSGDAFPTNSRWISADVLAGIGSAGPGFNQNQWRELVFCIEFAKRFQALNQQRQSELLDDPWAFDEWLKNVPDWEARQLRHMLLYLLFPDTFERIFGQVDRKAILQHYSTRGAPARMDPVQMDRELKFIRERLEAERGTEKLDFYLEPLASELRREPTVREEEATRSPEQGIEDEGVSEISQLLAQFIAQADEGVQLAVTGYLQRYRGLRVKVSFGVGNLARIPWIAFLGGEQAVQSGIYPVFLFYKEKGQVLLCYGDSETNAPTITWGAVEDAPTVRQWFLARGLGAPERYGASRVRLAFNPREPLPIAEIICALNEMIDLYVDRLGLESESATAVAPEPIVEPKVTEILEYVEDIGLAAQSFSAALFDSSVRFGENHGAIVSSFLASLVAKPLVILTGLSGSGKTQIAIRFGEWLGKDKMHVAAVRPDWTGAEALFGYEDALKPSLEGYAAWHVPSALEFMLRAVSDPQHPYLILLDEMNLAHVERYFADVLSGMESGQPCLPNLNRETDGQWRQRAGSKARVPFPKNLWIVGTVNIDETTYMFSPKVLDRASTFEFRVSAADLRSEATKPTPCHPGDAALVRGLLRIAKNEAWHLEQPSSSQPELDLRLRQLHRTLSKYGLEFGHRVFYESMRFAALLESAGTIGTSSQLDRIVMQKILPRLHGSRRRLELPLLALGEFCRDLPENPTPEEKLQTLEIGGNSTSAVQLPISYAKVVRMLDSLRANQFASFTE